VALTNPIYLRETASIVHQPDPVLEVVVSVEGQGGSSQIRIEWIHHVRIACCTGFRSTSCDWRTREPVRRAGPALRSPLPAFDRIVFAARSAAPMRLSVQPASMRAGARWGRSIYVHRRVVGSSFRSRTRGRWTIPRRDRMFGLTSPQRPSFRGRPDQRDARLQGPGRDRRRRTGPSSRPLSFRFRRPRVSQPVE
jgi:hypothetical protein